MELRKVVQKVTSPLLSKLGLKSTSVTPAPAATALPVATGGASAAPSSNTRPSPTVADIFGGIEGAKASFAANYVRPGHYFNRIDRLKVDKTRKGVSFLAIEMTVIAVLDNPEAKAQRVGENVTHMLTADKDSFLGNVKAFVANVLSCSADEVTPEHCKALTDETTQPLKGMVVEVVANTITTRAGKPFTRVAYRREVPATELLQVLDEVTKRKHWAAGALEALAEAEGGSSVTATTQA